MAEQLFLSLRMKRPFVERLHDLLKPSFVGFLYLKLVAGRAARSILLDPAQWRATFVIIGCLASVSIGVAATLLAKTVERLYGRESIPLTLVPVLTLPALAQSSIMMESWLAILFAAAGVYLVFGASRNDRSRDAFLVSIGLSGSLARTDFGMLPAALTVATLL